VYARGIQTNSDVDGALESEEDDGYDMYEVCMIAFSAVYNQSSFM
jgi:hypothetical protein